jgi:hypothetical protein
MIMRARGIGRYAAVIAALGLSLLCAIPAAAQIVAPLPESSYSVRSACAAPTSGHPACLALELVPRTAQARAHRHPIGIARAALAPSAPPSPAAGDFGLTPQALHGAYALPSSAPAVQTIALVDAYNDLDAESDLATYSKELDLPECTAANGCFEKVNQNGKSSNLPFPQTRAILTSTEHTCENTKETRAKREQACFLVGEAAGWSVEISLDIETAHAVCQNCHLTLVEADEASYEDLGAAEDAAATLGANEISNSWGGPECEGSCVEDSSAFEHPGVVIAAASGDNGYLDWLAKSPSPYANYPAASPHVVAVGGTLLRLAAGGERSRESVWNDGGESEGLKDGHGAGGSGCSTQFEAPPWQQASTDFSAVGCGTKRATVDVAADADPNSGVAVYDTVSGVECESEYEEEGTTHVVHWCTYGGTSLATPLIAATFALAGGADGVEYPARTLYENEASSPSSLYDVTEGSNGECRLPYEKKVGTSSCTAAEEAATSCPGEAICLARAGYDGPSGVGTPEGLAAFRPPSSGPTVTTGAASSLTQTSATVSASVNPNGHEVTACELEYGPTSAYGSSAPCSPEPGAGSSAVTVSAQLSNLTADSGYHYRAVATNADGTNEGSDKTFKTLVAGTPPAIDSESASHITEHDATIEASIDPEGLETEYEILIDDPCPTPTECARADVPVAQATLAPSATAQSVSVDLADAGVDLDIEPGTTYGYRVLASNGAGATEGQTQTFTTTPAAPTVTTGSVSSVTQTSASLTATVDPNGAEVSACTLEYGPTPAYGSSAPCSAAVGAGTSPVTVSASLTGLTPGTTYHYRAVATNAGGTGEGDDATFATQLPTTLVVPGPGQAVTIPVVGASTLPGVGVSAAQEHPQPPVPDAELARTSLSESSAGTVIVSVSCPAAEASCAGTVTLRTLNATSADARARQAGTQKAATLTLGAAPFNVAGGRVRRLTLRLDTKARALLARTRTLRARATIFARDPLGASHTAHVDVTIRAYRAAAGLER